MKQPLRILFIFTLMIFILSIFLVAQDSKDKGSEESDSKFWTFLIGVIGGGGILGFIQFLLRIRDEKRKINAQLEAEEEYRKKQRICEDRTAEEMYSAALKEELGTIHLLGSPDMQSPPVRLEDAFVSLSVLESWGSEKRFDVSINSEEIGVIIDNEIPGHELRQKLLQGVQGDGFLEKSPPGCRGQSHLSPAEVMKRAFKKYKLLLIIGDPGSGKTTLLKYYAMMCLDKTAGKRKHLGFEKEIMPIYFPLRELQFNSDEPASLADNLAAWCEKHFLNISIEQFQRWLQMQKTLVLLDGLDEISNKKQRQKVCKWIKRMCTGLSKACFVVTSRATGYRKLDGIELEVDHLRADIMDFSPQQQEEFLKRWFRAVFLSGLPPEGILERQWKQQQVKRADQRSRTIIEFLKDRKNKAVQELAAVPMLLQIIAIVWKERRHLPRSRPALYDAALNYLLDYRDRDRDIVPLLPAEESRRVLAPTALWMQEKLKRDEAPKKEMHQTMQEKLDTLEGQPRAEEFCEYLRDRSGLIADYDRDHYIFRHKSFREFLAALQLREDCWMSLRLEKLVSHFGEDWWEEPLRFFVSKSNDNIFDRFMHEFFKSKISRELDAHQQSLLQQLIREAPQKKIDALKECLNSDRLNINQKRYVMDCLKTIGTPEALETIEKADKDRMDESTRKYAEDITSEASVKEEKEYLLEVPRKKDLETLASFRNPFEDNVEYIKIPGGTYKYSVSGKMEVVPNLYFCKYPVTNKRYRRFISFLEGSERELLKKLPLSLFAKKLLEFALPVKGYTEYLGKSPDKWKDLLRSGYDDNKKFNGDDQPVVVVTWYAARAYCFWLSCLETAFKEGKKFENIDVKDFASIYRLPTEVEWEWAAGGEPDGSVREYPWPKERGVPNPHLANYGENVGATTPVGRYPEGATPAGVMDMAGNVWEWMGNYYNVEKGWPALRGGSWLNVDNFLRCSARYFNNPGIRYFYIGFRVLRAQS